MDHLEEQKQTKERTQILSNANFIYMSATDTGSDTPLNFAKPVRNGGSFANPSSFTNWTGIPGPWNLIKWKLFDTDESNIPDDEAVLDQTLPVHNITKFESQSNRRMFATWLGHATVLVQMEGVRFITDPIWSKRASFLQWIGPKRYRPPPMKIEDLPQCTITTTTGWDAVTKITVTLQSVNAMVRAAGHARLVEDNRDKEHIGTSGQGHRNGVRLWSGWAVMTPNRRFYYSGDTGFCETEFKKIGDQLGPFDLAAIPIDGLNESRTIDVAARKRGRT
ncbi:hypothetical protein OSTOST_03642 [Ostertagia ostertagi]